jgi:hypothetical protein
MTSWTQNEQIVVALVVVSVITFMASLVLMPLIVARLPTEYFCHSQRDQSFAKGLHPLLYLSLITLKNLIGALLILGGIAMLLLPGQGILTILIGIALTNFPKKYRLEKAIVRRRSVFRTMNWIRRTMRVPPLLPPKDELWANSRPAHRAGVILPHGHPAVRVSMVLGWKGEARDRLQPPRLEPTVPHRQRTVHTAGLPRPLPGPGPAIGRSS